MQILVPGTPVVDARSTWRCGIVADVSIGSRGAADGYFVIYDNDPTRKRYYRTREDILSADDAYIDQDGVRVAPLAFPEALRRVHAMAQCNLIDAIDVAFSDAGLAGQKEWLQKAVDTVEHLVRHAGAAADFGPRPVNARKWPESMVGSDRGLDPAMPSEALRICIGAARELDLETSRDAERRLIAQAISVTEDLVALYPSRLDEFRPEPSNVVAFQAG